MEKMTRLFQAGVEFTPQLEDKFWTCIRNRMRLCRVIRVTARCIHFTYDSGSKWVCTAKNLLFKKEDMFKRKPYFVGNTESTRYW